MNLTRPAPQLKLSIKLNHDAHLGNPLWVEQLPDLADQTPENLYIVYVPSEERDKVMGMFIECWDALETSLHHVFRLLARTPYDVTNVLISSFNGTKQIADAAYALAELVLQPDDLKAVDKLLDRVRSVATQRNRIVHGHWVMGLHYESIEGPHGVVFRPNGGDWERVYQPVSPTERQSLAVHDQQKVASKYRFSLDRLMQVCQTVLVLVDDLSTFSQLLSSKLPASKED
jgi:hypothetical protein